MRETARARALSGSLDPDALADAYVTHLTQPEVVEAFAGVMHHMTDPETRNRYHMARRLPFVTAPTLILWGTADATNDLALGEETHALIGGSRFLTFEGAGHNLPGERTLEFVAAVREFLGS
jgi:pimeloyl-ACP methyl ester carboxylesterase